MGVEIRETNNMDEVLNVIKILNSKTVQLGVFAEDGSFLVMIAVVNEFGAVIKPKPGKKALAIPDKKSKKVFFVKQVTIPERSFIRAGFDSNKGDIEKFIKKLLPHAVLLKMPVDEFHGKIGAYCVNKIREYMTNLRSPPNADITISNKGSTNPLIATGRLRQAITYRVVDI